MAKGQRIDERLVADGLADSRAIAQRLVMAGVVRVDGQRIDKPSRVVGEGLDARNNTPPILRGQLSQLFGGGPLDLDAIACHAASDP